MEKKLEEILGSERENSSKIDRLNDNLSKVASNVAVLAEQLKNYQRISAIQSDNQVEILEELKELVKKNDSRITILEHDRSEFEGSIKAIKVGFVILSSGVIGIFVKLFGASH